MKMDRLIRNSLIIVFLYMSVLFLLTYCCNCDDLFNSYLNLLTINLKDGENFIFQLWVAQLTFTTILVAFATVLFNVMNIRFYGISVLEIIKFKTYFWDVLFIILIIDILTYIPVAYHNLLFVVLSAFISSLLSLWFIWKVIDVLSNPEKYKKFVEEHYIETIRRDI